MKVYVGNDLTVTNNPYCTITRNDTESSLDASCDLIGQYVGVAVSGQA